MDGQPMLDGDLALEAAADLRRVDLHVALEEAGFGDLDRAAVGQHGSTRPSTTRRSQARISPVRKIPRPTISFLASMSDELAGRESRASAAPRCGVAAEH